MAIINANPPSSGGGSAPPTFNWQEPGGSGNTPQWPYKDGGTSGGGGGTNTTTTTDPTTQPWQGPVSKADPGADADQWRPQSQYNAYDPGEGSDPWQGIPMNQTWNGTQWIQRPQGYLTPQGGARPDPMQIYNRPGF
jgi:hypothetical protein